MKNTAQILKIVQKVLFKFLYSRYTPAYYQSPVVRGFINSNNELELNNPYDLSDVLAINLETHVVGSTHTLILNEIKTKIKKKLKIKPSLDQILDILESGVDFFYEKAIFRYIIFLNNSTGIECPEIALFFNASIMCSRLGEQWQ